MSAFATIPPELRARDQWVVFLWEPNPGKPKPKKVPYRTDLSAKASSTDPATWGSYETAVTLVEAGRADAVGYAFSPDDPFAGVDIDDLPDWEALQVARRLDSYTERSVSGKLHVILRGSLNGGGRHLQTLGVFDQERFFVVTGAHVEGFPATIEDRQAQLDAVCADFLPPQPEPAELPEPQPVDATDEELLERMFAAKNGSNIERLWRGDTSGHDDDHSRADEALCTHLAWWTGNEPDRIDRLFRSSGLYRAKWDERRGDSTYGDQTIKYAISKTPTPYQPNPPNGVGGPDSVDSDKESLGAASRDRSSESALEDSDTPDAAAPVVSQEPRSESTPDSDPVFALPIRDFISREREHREPLLASEDGRATVGRSSLTLVGALGGQGKTTFSVDVFLYLAAGVDFPPWTVPQPVSILLIENEGPEELFAEKLAGRLEHFRHELRAPVDVCTFDWGGFSLANDSHRERLTAEIAAKGYDLVFGDPLDSLGVEGVGSPEDTRKFLELMKRTGLNKTVAWWLNTHPRKAETREALDEIAGAWGGKPDTVFLLRMLEDDRTQIRQPKLRWAKRGKGPTLLFKFDPDTEAFSFLGEQSEEERDYLAEIVDLLGDGSWRLVKEIAATAARGGIGANDKIVKNVLEEHPDIFDSCTGDAAKELGRRPDATLWQLREAEDEGAPDPERSRRPTETCVACGQPFVRGTGNSTTKCPACAKREIEEGLA